MRQNLEKKIILFVCTGNTCRSVMAQALFQKIIEDSFSELKYLPDSAGIAANKGESASREAIFCMAGQGVDITSHQAKPVNENLLKESSLILTMTDQQLNYIIKEFPSAKNKTFLFKLFCHQKKFMKNDVIEDPFGQGLIFYQKICKTMKHDIRKLISHLREDCNYGQKK